MEKVTNGSKAGGAIMALLTEHPDGLTRKELEKKGATTIPRNRAGFYIREGVEYLKDQGVEVVRIDKVYSIQA